MTSEEMTTGSLSATDAQRKEFAARSRWWNSTGGGSTNRTLAGQNTAQTSNSRGFGAIKAGDGGKRFKEQWPELDEENWKWMEEKQVDPQTGKSLVAVVQNCSPETNALRRRTTGSNAGLGAVVEGGQAARDAGQGWMRRNGWKLVAAAVFMYVLAARLLSDQKA